MNQINKSLKEMKTTSIKHLLALLVAMLASASFSFAQKTVADYHSDYFDNDYKISVSTSEKNPSIISDVYIEVEGEQKNQKVTLDYENPEQLLSSLKEVSKKYAEWISVAEENHITEMSKEIPVDMPAVTVCWYGIKWYFSFKKRFKFDFMILESGKKIIVMTGKVTASSNEYIDKKFYWVFQSVAELDEFIKKLDYPKFIEKLNEKTNNADLFK